MQFHNNLPIHKQLVDEFTRQIVTGKLASGEKMHSVRELAEIMGVNPNTMQKALATLEGLGLVYAERTSGRFVTRDGAVIAAARSQLITSHLEEFTNSMQALGVRGAAMIELLSDYVKGKGSV